MATIWEVPLLPRSQKLRVSIGSDIFTLHVQWNKVSQTWVMDIHDAADNPLPNGGCHGVPLVTGTDLMGQFRYLGIGGGVPMTAMTVGPGISPDTPPSWTNLGTDGHLYFKTLV